MTLGILRIETDMTSVTGFYVLKSLQNNFTNNYLNVIILKLILKGNSCFYKFVIYDYATS